MTINIADNSPRVSYDVAEGVTQSSFTVSFEFFDNDDLNVYVDGTLKTLTTDYTVTGGDGSTGSITMSVTGATGGSTVVITRDIDLERTTDFPASGAFNIATLNTELDRIIAITADLEDRTSRALQLTDFDADADLSLPDLDARKGTVLAFNSVTGAVEGGPKTTNINQVADISDAVDTVADISSDVTTVSGISANVTTVSGISANVTTVAGNNANVTTVAGINSDITTVAGNNSNVTTVAGFSSDVTTAAGISANITTVAGDSADIQALAAKTTELGLLGTADAVSDMNLLASSAIITDMDALANLTAEIDALGDVTSDITTVSGISANVTTVAGVSSDVTTVAGIDSDVTSVSGVSADVTTVAGISANVTTVAGVSSDVTTVAGVSSDVTSVSGISSDVTSVAGITANVTTVANNISDVNNFANAYRIAATDPTTSLDEGDLVFNTTSNKVKVYNGTAWQDVAPVATSITASQISDVTASATELNYNDITTLGLTEASKVVTADANGVVSFDNGTIEEVTSITSSSNAATINLRDGNLFEHDLTENVTYTFSNPAASGRASCFILKVIQGSTARTITWPSSVDWAAATAPTLTTTNDGVDVFAFITIDGGTTYYGFTLGQAMG